MIAKVYDNKKCQSEKPTYFTLTDMFGNLYLEVVDPNSGKIIATVLRINKDGTFNRFPLPDGLGFKLNIDNEIDESWILREERR